jgi:hypothetical protein
MESQLQEEVRTKVPTLDDVMSTEELEQVTAEGLTANPEETPEQTKEAMEKAQQMETYQNYLRQQAFFHYLGQRPVPATIHTIDWALVRYELIIHEKKEFDNDLSIARLNEHQWYHGITTGNIRVFQGEDGKVGVSLVVPYDRYTTNLAYTPEQLAAQRAAQQARMSRKQRRQLH